MFATYWSVTWVRYVITSLLSLSPPTHPSILKFMRITPNWFTIRSREEGGGGGELKAEEAHPLRWWVTSHQHCCSCVLQANRSDIGIPRKTVPEALSPLNTWLPPLTSIYDHKVSAYFKCCCSCQRGNFSNFITLPLYFIILKHMFCHWCLQPHQQVKS